VARLEGGRADLQVVPDFASVLTATAEALLVLIDMPIGLCEQGERPCEAGARALLRPFRHSSVFPVPVQAAVYAAEYREALRINREATGKGFSIQSFHITPKIAEVDRIMQMRPALQTRIRESHPELCLAALNGGRPMAHSKKSSEGRQERLDLLTRYLPAAAETLQARVRGAAPDDLLDALVLAVSAQAGLQCGLRTTAPAQFDAHGLAMEIVYPVT
jgi:predicted RNase H-like nuclease